MSIVRASCGEVAEWSKAHAWNACRRCPRLEGSNPSLTAICFNEIETRAHVPKTLRRFRGFVDNSVKGRSV